MKLKRRNLTAKPTGPIQLAVGRMLDVKQAAALLGTSERWIRRRISRRLLPYRRIWGVRKGTGYLFGTPQHRQLPTGAVFAFHVSFLAAMNFSRFT